VSDDKYLFDGTGEPDPEVEKLERALRPLGREDGPVFIHPTLPRARFYAFGALAAVAACILVVVSLQVFPAYAPLRYAPRQPVVAAVPEIKDAAAAATLKVGEWIETKDAAREILVGDVGRVQLAADSRLQVRHVSADETRLYLERGSMEAFVSADARPRFFQVDTDAARCVDLGCRYTLEVADDGDAKVRVVTGQVAFEDGRREVFVPAGAVCTARKGRGSGTPRFEETRVEVASAFDAYDAAPAERRRELAKAALDAVRDARDTLPAWHLLQDGDAETVRAAEAKLEAVAGKLGPSSASDARTAWKEKLAAECW
jgi:hypothetical protein